MKEIIAKIRELLDSLEVSTSPDDDQIFVRNFDALEIPEIVAGIVDYLQPSLKGYEAPFYWYLFRNPILKTGHQYLRVSVRGPDERCCHLSNGPV